MHNLRFPKLIFSGFFRTLYGCVVKDVETVLIVSVSLVNVPSADRLRKDPFEIIHTDDYVEVDAEKVGVTIT